MRDPVELSLSNTGKLYFWHQDKAEKAQFACKLSFLWAGVTDITDDYQSHGSLSKKTGSVVE